MRDFKVSLLLKLILPCFFLIAFVPKQCSSQSLFSTSGGYISGNGFSLSYSIGETLTQQLSGPLILSNGFQQPYGQSLNLLEFNSFSISLTPVPIRTDDIKVKGLKDGALYNVFILDQFGKMVWSDKLIGSEQEIILRFNYNAGVYFVNFSEVHVNGKTETIKVVKL